ncbi:MAG: hypothetical protein BM563_07080 [Bacteroidetes bacterium MedPE-SWsnd-G1]|nr:MAG: hypothetical protein BM563_07080 [Bacteroidetes bacterium MedPE-SWsnd-G1]
MLKKYILTFLIGVISISTFANSDTAEPSRLILFLGRFHPLILHLPIGALLITFYLDIVGRLKKQYQHKAVHYSLGFSAVFAVLTCLLGYFLSLEGGYDESVLDFHFYLGFAAAVMIIVLFFMSKSTQKNTRLLFFPFFVLTIACLSAAGHYGSVLTHGENFITEYAYAPEEEPLILEVDSLKIFENVVYKILDDKCIQCHNSTKKKGDLSLLTKETILKGGESGIVLHPNDPFESLIYSSALLPITDDTHMPPEGKPQLTKDELWVLKYWIRNNADFQAKIHSLPINDTLKRIATKFLVLEKKKIPFASDSDISKVQESGFSVTSIVPNKPELTVKFLEKNATKANLKKLNNIGEQIVELDLNNSGISDNMLENLERFSNLKRLRLDNTDITDKTLSAITNLEDLEFLNLYNTKITLNGLKDLLENNPIPKIYTWSSEIASSDVSNMEKEFNVSISNGVFDGFVEKVALKKPVLNTEKTLFVDTISIRLETKMRGAEIRYSLDSTQPNEHSELYTKPIILKEGAYLMARVYKNNWLPSETLNRSFSKIGVQIEDFSLKVNPDKRYPGAAKLFDFEEGSLNFRDGKWTGFNGLDIEAIVDLKEQKSISSLSVNCLENFNNYILYPNKISLYTSNSKQGPYKFLGSTKIKSLGPSAIGHINRFVVKIPETKSQFFKIIVSNPKKLPSSHPAAGDKPWIFVDEIMLH